MFPVGGRRVARVVAAVALAAAAARLCAQSGGELKLCRHPAVSPDGASIAFSHQGDVWVAALAGGTATRVTSHPAREDVVAWSPDGRSLAFQSDRFGDVDVMIANLAGGEPRRLTFHSDDDRLSGFSGDGSKVLFVSRRHVLEGRRYGKLYAIPVGGGTETPVFDLAADDAALSPDGRRVALTRGADSWWRLGYRGSARLEIWVADLPDGAPRRATKSDGNDFGPMWHPEGGGFYFVRERDRARNVWWQPVGGEAAQITTIPSPGVRFPNLNARGTHLAFEADDGVYVVELDPAEPSKPKAPPRRVPLRGFSEGPQAEFEAPVSGDVVEYDLSPDDKSMLVVSGGEIFCVERKKTEPKHARRLTDTAAGERDAVFARDSDSALFVSDASGEEQIWRVKSSDPKEKRLARALSFGVERLTDSPGGKRDLAMAPDRKTVAYVRGLGDLVLADPDTLADRRVLSTGFSPPKFAWSGDSRWIAAAKEDDDFNRDVWIFDAAGGEAPYNVSRHPDNDGDPAWDPKGRFLAFASKSGLFADTDIQLAFLRKADFEKSPLEWEDEFEEAKKAASRPESRGASRPAAESKPRADGAESQPAKADPVVVDFPDLHKRVRVPAPGPGSRASPAFAPDGRTIAYLQQGAEAGVWTVEFDGKEKKKLQPAPASALRWSGDELFYLSGGQVCSTTKAGAKTTWSFSGVRTRRPREERRLVFVEAWRKMRDHFYDPAMHGADWAAARAKFEPLAALASTPEDLTMVVQLLLGELNASHVGFRPTGTWTAPAPSKTAELGVLWDEAFPGPGLRVARAVEGTPAAREKSRLLPGDVVLAVDGRRVADAPNAWALFDRLAGRDVRLSVARGGAETDVVIVPVDTIARQLADDRTLERRAFTHARSDGKVGYVRVAAMSEPEVVRFEHELFSEGYDKSCLIIDVRGNGGGWTSDYLFTILTQADHAVTAPRGGGPGYPQDRRVFAAWTKPITVLCDEWSYSNAEIFSHGIKTLKRGPLVGVQTYGAVISTDAFTLLDGSTLRKPFRGWRSRGTGLPMELHGCVPDMVVENPPEEVARGRDRQLEKAIEASLAQIK